MAEIAVNLVIDKLLPLLDQEARLLGGVHTQVEDIKTELLYIQAFLMDADAKAEKADVSQGLKTWIQDLRETAYSIEDVIDEYLLHLGNPNRRHGFIGSTSSKGSAPQPDPPVTSLFIDDSEIVGIGSQKNELISRLVYANMRVVKHFDCHAWITVSQSFQMKELLRRMMEKFYEARKEKRYDDYIHRLPHLSPDSSRELFCKKAFQGRCPPELKKLSDDIVKRCGGLPLAIVAIGGLLSRKEKIVSLWKKFKDYTIKCGILTRLCHIHDLMREIILKKAEELSFFSVMAGEASKKIPEDLGNLLHLRYLSLRKTRVRMLPRSIGKLQNLQTLDLKYSLVEDLPVEINRLQKLCNILCFDYAYKADLRWDSIITELGKLRQLRKLGITKLSRGNGQLFQALPSLQALSLFQTSVVEQLCFGATGIQKLKRLRIYDLIGLKRVKIEDGTLPLLEELMIGRCPQLEELPSGIRHLKLANEIFPSKDMGIQVSSLSANKTWNWHTTLEDPIAGISNGLMAEIDGGGVCLFLLSFCLNLIISLSWLLV
ncbi:unnamed protein product, partial [Vitis vinifera]